MKRLFRYIAKYDLKMELATAGVLVVGVLAVPTASRAGYPVIDVTNLAQNVQILAQTLQQVHQGARQIQQLASQIGLMKQELESLTGSRGLGGIYRGGYEQDMGQWSPQGYDAMLTSYRTGSGLAGSLSNEVQQVRSRFQPVKEPDFLAAPTRQEDIDSYYQAAGATAISHAAASQALDDMNEEAIRLRNLGDEIDKTQDTKAAVDLQNRLLYEQLVLQQEQMRLAALGMAQGAARDQKSLSTWETGQSDLANAYRSLQGGSR
jgi:hypothetical protein